MKKHLLVAVLVAVSLGLGVSNTPINAQAKTLSTLPKALRGNWKKHLGWGHYKQSTWEKAYTYVGHKHSFWEGMTQSDTYPSTVRYVISKGHGLYKVHVKTTMGGTSYHVVTMKRTKHTLRVIQNGYGITYTSHHKAIE